MKLYQYLVIFLSFAMHSCTSQSEKINGVSFVASRDIIDETNVNPIVEVNANYAAVMPFGFIRDLDHPNIQHNTNRQWYGETQPGTKQYIEELRKKEIKVMIKPQIWVRRGEFTGLIKMSSEENWKILEETYTSFILLYAQLAKDVNAEILCIGTELELFVEHRPQYWIDLIADIKTIYNGKLTYAANWDEFKRTPFWDKLDYIGVDAYFPVSDLKTPTVEDCIEGWKVHKPVIENLSKTYNKPILFTEYGYRSVDFAGREPWASDMEMDDVNLQAQVNTTKALYETFWKEPWFAGGFVWKWFHRHHEVGGEENSRFTPQNKPAEAVIKAYYKSNK
ncbi:glycoside hydrolase [Winogradskyella eckloniae]|uniref:glycoside hydrolase family 113 n=1 Tax=Winogradskyella eckloniae TaxID=1089306 RepID=UPI0015643802|nr:glycoside hydrolase [Winogradskyella eckloniae]NRD19271.1 glycoside hydrolase [Winogradskyella eckloniae]